MSVNVHYLKQAPHGTHCTGCTNVVKNGEYLDLKQISYVGHENAFRIINPAIGQLMKDV